MITEKKQVNSNITLNNIYNAIRYLKPEYQVTILDTYKITELYSILADEEHMKYINDLFAVANEYSNRAYALMSLYTEARKESKGERNFNLLETMSQTYDGLEEEDKKKFCKNMLEKKNFFQNAHTMMMNSFKNAVEIQKDNIVIQQTEK